VAAICWLGPKVEAFHQKREFDGDSAIAAAFTFTKCLLGGRFLAELWIALQGMGAKQLFCAVTTDPIVVGPVAQLGAVGIGELQRREPSPGAKPLSLRSRGGSGAM
jgi:hypothetical protein